jgi:hypothetical protein
MKAKLNTDYHGFAKGFIVEVHECSDSEFYDLETPEGLVGIFKWRVDLIKDPIEEKKKEISDARIKLEVLEKELAEMTAPKQGQKYKHKDGAIYLLSLTSQGYCLVCIESKFPEQVGGVYSYCEGKYPENAFQGFRENFTLIEE